MMVKLYSGYIYTGSFVKQNIKPESIFFNGEMFLDCLLIKEMINSINDNDSFIVNEFQDEESGSCQALIQLFTANRVSITLHPLTFIN